MLLLKDSGTEWLGQIPASWELSRIGSLYTLRNTKVSDKDYPPLSVTMNGIVPQLETAAKTNAHDDRKLVKKGDFAINSRSDRRGSCGISDYDGSVSLINTILSPNGEMNPGYYNWLFHTVQFADEFYANGHGIVDDLWTTGWQEMKKILIPSPSMKEQEKIASFLDSKCAEIDALSADIQAEIDTLEEYKKSVITEAVTKGLNPDVEMKDSEIDYIGEYPANWSLTKNKYLLIERNHRSQTGNEELLSVSQYKGVVPSSTIQRTMQATNLIGYKKVYKNDLVFNKLNPVLARFGVSDYDGITSPDFSVYYTTSDTLTQFMCYLLKTDAYITEYGRICTGVGDGFSRLYTPMLYNIWVAIPDIQTQQQIADYLDGKISKIESVVALKKEQLATLDEYKKSVIYEYATGKKEVQ